MRTLARRLLDWLNAPARSYPHTTRLRSEASELGSSAWWRVHGERVIR